MKVGILTFHEGINHGAYMQAFSTYQFLLQNGYDAEIINYKNRTHYLFELKAFLVKKNPLHILQNIKKIRAFKEDHSSMNLGKMLFDRRKLIGKYDAIVVGSDIVWNFKSRFLGRDPVYFGKDLEDSKLISYAPSFGNVNSDDAIPDFVSEGLQYFSSISVRDINSSNLVKKVIGVEPKIVLDPTFLIDAKPFEQSTGAERKPYLLVYAYYLRDGEIKSAIAFARKKGLEIISIGYQNTWADKNVIALGPFEWLSYFHHASFVLTSTFHGTIFSLKYEKNFATSMNDNIKNKTISLIKHLDLADRFVEGGDVADVFRQEIDYSVINKKLTPLVQDSQEFLLNALGEK
ncbi:polysaccharide pyruvyl transferase family protein [Thiomicrorhabdus sp.]|uniref:polysaccharide pyruvyl transferase family protein n=1 Tax=Thiomicrorhabdus sp. TaxID=2039724 RepID=UPI0029C80AF4|nr:polysaccharide pyruvyl transferase family protein [Thiomicrorhabdus sp.]